MGPGIDNKIDEILCNPKNVKKTRNTRLEKCYGHVNIATAFLKSIFIFEVFTFLLFLILRFSF